MRSRQAHAPLRISRVIALALVAALVALTPAVIEVAPGEKVTVEVKTGAGGFVHGAGFGAEDKTIAEARGWLGPNERRGKVTVTGLRRGRTRLIVEYPVGMGVWRQPVADIVIDDPCEPPSVALSLRRLRIAEGAEVTVTAMTTGTASHIEWYAGTRFAALGPTFTVRDLPRGTHRFTARVSSACGTAVSEELIVEVVAPRRRTVRR